MEYLETEKPESNVMHRPPRDIQSNIFGIGNLSLAILQGLGLMIITVILYMTLLNMEYPIPLVTTITFGCLVLGNLLLVVISRSKHMHIITVLKKPNPAQHWIILGVTSLFIGFTSIPFFRERFNFSELTENATLLIFLSGIIGLLWHESLKAIYRYRDQVKTLINQ